jgi:hypothetical protein
MKIVVKKVGQAPEIKEIQGTLENLKEIVGGYIECIHLFDNVFCVCNEEGKLLGLPANFKFCNDVIAGDVFFCAGAEEEFISLNDRQISVIMTVFNARM